MNVEMMSQGAVQAPPIPALPSRPGASTGNQNAPVVVGGAPGADVAREVGDALREAVSEIRSEVNQGGVQTSTSQPPFPNPRDMIPPEVIPLTAMTLVMVAVVFIGWPIARAFGRRMDRRTELGTMRAADLQPQIRQLQDSVDSMAIELERIGEAQRFTAKLLAERAPALPAAESRQG